MAKSEEKKKLLKNIVYWYDSEGNEIIIKVKRTPRLGWFPLTLMEKCMDSAATSLHIQKKRDKPDFTTALKSLHEGLTIARREIESAKRNNPKLIFNTCEFRETKRTRCRGYPTKFNNIINEYRCKKHY